MVNQGFKAMPGITINETRYALTKLKANRAPGKDGIAIVGIKLAEYTLMNEMENVLKFCLNLLNETNRNHLKLEWKNLTYFTSMLRFSFLFNTWLQWFTEDIFLGFPMNRTGGALPVDVGNLPMGLFCVAMGNSIEYLYGVVRIHEMKT